MNYFFQDLSEEEKEMCNKYYVKEGKRTYVIVYNNNFKVRVSKSNPNGRVFIQVGSDPVIFEASHDMWPNGKYTWIGKPFYDLKTVGKIARQYIPAELMA